MEALTLRDIRLGMMIYNRPGIVEVFKAIRIKPNSPQHLICVKKIYVNSIFDANQKNKECMIMLKLHHDNIVNLISSSMEGVDRSIDYLVLFMDCCEGGDLERLIKVRAESQQPWTQDELFVYFAQLISGFAYLQRNGVAHRDIKPSNIFVTDNSKTLKIGDLGASAKVNGNNFSIIGTPLYLSPLVRQAFFNMSVYGDCAEAIHDLYKSDVYSLGIVFLYMTTFEDIKELARLENLQNIINSTLNRIPEKYWKIKILLSHMLQVEERNRPNFVELEGLFNEIRYLVPVIMCSSCQANKPEDQFQVYESQRICGECVSLSNHYVVNPMVYCSICGTSKSQKEVKVVGRDCVCGECISKVNLFPESEA